MWNNFQTDAYEGMIAETTGITGHGGKPIHAYYARPIGEGPFPGILLIHHMPGWDQFTRETARRFAAQGYSVIAPNLYEDFGHGTPEEVVERAQEKGGMADKDVMEDCGGALNFLRSQPGASGKVGVIGMCSGGRHTFLAACTLDGIDCAVDCWGGGVVCQPEQLTPQRPVQPLDYADKLSCPLLGIFGNDDWSPTREDVDILEARLKELGKDYEFHRYDGAAHGFWYYHRPMYRHEQAMDSLEKVLAFFQKHLT